MSENDKSRDGEVTIDYVQLSNLWPIYVLKCLFSSSKKRVPKKSASNIIFQRPGPSSKHCNSRPMGPKPRLDRSLRVTSPCIQKNVVVLRLLPCLHLAVCQNLVPVVNIKIAGKWMFIPLELIIIGIDPYPPDRNHVFLLLAENLFFRERKLECELPLFQMIGQ